MSNGEIKLQREQEIAINHNEGNLIVSASAGSGKTFVMIERIKRLIKEGRAKISEILAITFTEAAAKDMKRKLTEALSKLAETDKSFYSQLIEVQTADVCTIDSFAVKLLRTYFYKVDLSPDFRVADESETFALKKVAIDNVFRRLYASKNQDFLRLVKKFLKKRKDEELREEIIKLYGFLSSEKEVERLFEITRAYCNEKYQDMLNECVKHLQQEAEKTLRAIEVAKVKYETAKLAKSALLCEKFIGFAQNLPYENDIYGFINFKFPRASFDSVALPYDFKAYYNDPIVKFKKVIKTFEEVLGTSKDQGEEQRLTVSQDTQVLIDIEREFIKEYTLVKREENVVDFVDMEALVLKLFEDSETLSAVRSNYKYVFVDECQDINDIQESIIDSVSNGNLFMVGDVKQSIYGFRGAKSEIFTRRYSIAEQNNEAQPLNYNFRCAKNIIDFVNEVFCYSMTKATCGIDYAGTSKLIEGNVYPSTAPGEVKCYELFPEEKEKKSYEDKVYDILEAINLEDDKDISCATKQIYKIINEVVGSDYYDFKEKEEDKKIKKVQYKDILILSRTKENEYVKGIKSGLEKYGIKVESEVKDNVLNFTEIKVLVSALNLISDFSLDIPLVAVLKSPIGSFTDEDLIKVYKFYNEKVGYTNGRVNFETKLSYYKEQGEDATVKGKIERFYEYFEKLRFVADFMSGAEVVEKLVCDFDFEVYYSACAEDNRQGDRIRFFISACRKGVKPMGVSELVKFIKENPKAFDQNSRGGVDSVKLMTMHSSKGLEYPVVIVVGLEKGLESKVERDEKIACHRKCGIGMNFFDERSKRAKKSLYRLFIDLNRAKDRTREEQQLLYVALTRAKYKLFVIKENIEVEQDDSELEIASRMVDFIPQTITFEEVFESDLSMESAKGNTKKILVGKSNEKLVEEIRANINHKYPYEEEISLPLKSSVTSVLSQEQNVLDLENVFPEHTEVGETGKERGIIAHKILELYDFESMPNIYSHVNSLVESGVIAKSQADLIDLEKIANALKNEAFSGLKGKTLYREKSFLANFTAKELFGGNSEEKVLVQGVIDLLVVNGNEAEILDYKYSSLKASRLEEKYAKQLKLYASATERALGVRVVRKSLVSLLTGEVIDIK